MGTRNNNRITHAQFYQLSEWVKKNKELLLATKPTAPEACDLAKKELGFPIAPGSIKEAKTAAGVEWSSGYGSGAGIAAALLREVALGQTLVASCVLQPSEELKRAIREHLGRLKAMSNGAAVNGVAVPPK